MKNPMIDFVAELAVRLFSSKPKFFAIVQWISTILGSAAAVLMYLHTEGVALPVWTSKISEVSVIVGSIVALVMAQLPNKNPEEPAK